jgi:hypothetical protein
LDNLLKKKTGGFLFPKPLIAHRAGVIRTKMLSLQHDPCIQSVMGEQPEKKIVLLLAAALPGQFESLRNFNMSHLHFIGLGHFEL